MPFASELPFRDLIDSAPDGILVCDPRRDILLANAEAERIFGYAREELLGKPLELLIPERMRPRHATLVEGYAGTPRQRPMGIGMELVGRRKDGSDVPIEISLAPVQTARGLLVTAGIRDVTERRRLEHENRRANAYLVSAVDAVNEAFALFDENDRVVIVNSAARQLLGPHGAVIGMTFEAMLDRALRDGVFDFSNESREALFTRWLAYHRAPVGVLEVRTGTGRYLRVTESKTAEHGTVATIADVTDDVLRTEELRAARATAEAASAAKSEFLSSMSHELRTPLSSILGFAQLLERDRKRPLDERQLDRVHHVLRGGEHLLRLIDDVLDLSRIEAGGIVVSPESVDARQVVDGVVQTLAPMAERHGIALSIEPEAAPVQVIADRTRLAQILMNFGSNAIKYGTPSGHATFSFAHHPGSVRISVTDDGIGIAPEKHDKVFEPFQRAGQEAGPIEGTGIGLTITKRLAELMRGHVGFTSTPGQGSVFWVELPVDAQATRAPVRPARASGVSPLAHGAPRHKIVYIEDNPSNIAFMEDLIGELPSVTLITAPSAELGLELVAAHAPDLVIMDINLPGMSGFDAIARLRASAATRHIPVLALSAAALLRETKRGAQAGFDRYLTKPVNVGELTAALEELLP